MDFTRFRFLVIYGDWIYRPPSTWPGGGVFAIRLSKEGRSSFCGEVARCVVEDVSEEMQLTCCCSAHCFSLLFPHRAYTVDLMCPLYQSPLLLVQNICSFAAVSFCFPMRWFIYTQNKAVSAFSLWAALKTWGPWVSSTRKQLMTTQQWWLWFCSHQTVDG